MVVVAPTPPTKSLGLDIGEPGVSLAISVYRHIHASIDIYVCVRACVVYTTPVEEKSIRDYRSLRLCVRKRWSNGEMVDASIITSRNNNNVIRGKNGERCIPRYREKTSNVLGGRQLEFNG